MDAAATDLGPVAMAVAFYPRGGSAQVVKYLGQELAAAGVDLRLFSGSLGRPGEPTHAATFYEPLAPTTLDFSAAADAFRAGRDPMDADPPMQPSFEDRGEVPDKVLTALSPAQGERQVEAWRALFAASAATGQAPPAVAHLHHLTAQHRAFRDVHPGVPVIAHLHGTELLLLEELAASPAASGSSADRWQQELTEAAHRADRLVVVSADHLQRAERVLGLPGPRFTLIPNGFDTERFGVLQDHAADAYRHWRRWLVEEPLGWREDQPPGSIRYTDDDLAVLRGEGAYRPRVLLFVGRFTAVKQLPMLLYAYQQARPAFRHPTALVVWGGFPGEVEGEHPYTVARRLGLSDVFFVGWRGHDDLPTALNAADVLVVPSRRESFGQVYLEAMACGRPAIATSTGGQTDFMVGNGPTANGWLVDRDDVAALARALVAAVNDDAERQRRGANGKAMVEASYAWSAIARRWLALYAELAS